MDEALSDRDVSVGAAFTLLPMGDRDDVTASEQGRVAGLTLARSCRRGLIDVMPVFHAR